MIINTLYDAGLSDLSAGYFASLCDVKYFSPNKRKKQPKPEKKREIEKRSRGQF